MIPDLYSSPLNLERLGLIRTDAMNLKTDDPFQALTTPGFRCSDTIQIGFDHGSTCDHANVIPFVDVVRGDGFRVF